MEAVSCPNCKGTKLERYGKTKVGLQKYHCLGCRRHFTFGSDHLVDPKKKEIVLGLLAQDTPPKKIAAAVSGISLRWIQELKRRM